MNHPIALSILIGTLILVLWIAIDYWRRGD